MAVKIKLKRMGKIRNPQYRIIVADSRTKRDGRAIEELGLYHPKEEPSLIRVDSARVQHWLSVGAQPTDPVRAILKVTGDWQQFTGEPGAEGTLRTKEPSAAKSEIFARVLAEVHKGDTDDTTSPRRPAKKPASAPAAQEAVEPVAETSEPAEQPADASAPESADPADLPAESV